MPKIGMQPIRRQALIEAAIQTIHERGSLEVTVGQIAKRAGVSSALAHHYFGSKDSLILSTMRYLLTELTTDLRATLAAARTPRDRITQVIRANFTPSQFDPAVVSAWLVFYVRAQSSPEARRLLRVYAGRLHSNLAHALAQITDSVHAHAIAEGAGALIDGLYIRRALKSGSPDPESAIQVVETFVDAMLAQSEPIREISNGRG
jgi:TetR/AcrR family transcriptional regulator, transcriptional repressor of bet genes